VKYKRCCLPDEERAAQAGRFDDEVGHRMQDWAIDQFGEELEPALREFAGVGHKLGEGETDVFALWYHNHREASVGGTPAQRYAARLDLEDAERAAASRIASARLGLFRVLAVEPGRSLSLEELDGGEPFEVRSPKISHHAVRWDILLTHVMEGDPPSLWGPTRTFEPREELELREELHRLDGAHASNRALALLRFVPPSRSAPPKVFTLEGDLVELCSASWAIRDTAAVRKKLGAAGIEITVPREALLEDRPELPPGALVLESGPLGELERVPIASVRIEGGELVVEAMSEWRLEFAADRLERDLGDLIGFEDWQVRKLEEALETERSSGAPRERLPIPRELEEQLVGGALTEYMLRWLDEPNPSLGGQTPREALAGSRRGEVEILLRSIENGAERSRLRGEPAVDISLLREQLGLPDELAA
jgi:hypothetical protein